VGGGSTGGSIFSDFDELHLRRRVKIDYSQVTKAI
jgi:hypothetical protein